MAPTVQIPDVKAITFEGFNISTDGELLIFTLKDASGNKGHIAINWLSLTTTTQLINRAAEKAAETRASLGKSDSFYPGREMTAQLVSTFQVSEFPSHNLKVLSLQSPVGFRCDFAIPTNTKDQLGRPYPRAIAEELLRDSSKERQKPN